MSVEYWCEHDAFLLYLSKKGVLQGISGFPTADCNVMPGRLAPEVEKRVLVKVKAKVESEVSERDFLLSRPCLDYAQRHNWVA